MAVYFIRDLNSGLVKVGHGRDPWRRLTMLQTGCPGPLEMVAIIEGDAEVERDLHVRFAAKRERGEWFRVEGAFADYIESLPRAEKAARTSKTKVFWNGLPTERVAEQTGLSKGYLSDICNGKRRPSPENAIRLQRLTGVSAIKLIFGDLAEEAA